jgi:hypothetical protein
MSSRQIDELYRRSPSGTIPDGPAHGTAILAPGTAVAPLIARFVRAVGWQGKVFDRQHGELLNSITPLRILAVRARVYHGESWLDGRESIILDYSRTSLLARWVRDEIREVSPGVYLGFAYVFRIRVIAFALKFR